MAQAPNPHVVGKPANLPRQCFWEACLLLAASCLITMHLLCSQSPSHPSQYCLSGDCSPLSLYLLLTSALDTRFFTPKVSIT